ncbi:low affinity iron permease family protein [Sphingomonas sp. GCM10030256]|uniref:low affinity iron permease family protein n=1 Tax=Sphingomonas sp. GCM10030256 TaxID=3273427 RepID=UPI003607C43F
MAQDKHRLVQIGDQVSDLTSKLFAHPAMQIGVILFCIAWFVFGFHADLLTAALSILAITLTQMVLNGQYDREAEAHRRDVAMHAKLDELLVAMKGARDEMAGIEELDEEDITQLKEQVKEAIEAKGEQAGNPRERAAAKQAVEEAEAEVIKEARQRKKVAVGTR